MTVSRRCGANAQAAAKNVANLGLFNDELCRLILFTPYLASVSILRATAWLARLRKSARAKEIWSLMLRSPGNFRGAAAFAHPAGLLPPLARLPGLLGCGDDAEIEQAAGAGGSGAESADPGGAEEAVLAGLQRRVRDDLINARAELREFERSHSPTALD